MIYILKYHLISVFAQCHKICLSNKQNKTKPNPQVLLSSCRLLPGSSTGQMIHIGGIFFPLFFSPHSLFSSFFFVGSMVLIGKKFRKPEILSILSILHNNTNCYSFFLSFPSLPINETHNLCLTIVTVLV